MGEMNAGRRRLKQRVDVVVVIGQIIIIIVVGVVAVVDAVDVVARRKCLVENNNVSR